MTVGDREKAESATRNGLISCPLRICEWATWSQSPDSVFLFKLLWLYVTYRSWSPRIDWCEDASGIYTCKNDDWMKTLAIVAEIWSPNFKGFSIRINVPSRAPAHWGRLQNHITVEPLTHRFAWASRDFTFHIRYSWRHFESTQSLLHNDWSSVSNVEAVA